MKSNYRGWSGWMVVAGAMVVSVLLLTAAADAMEVSPSSLFLSPSLIQEDIYPGHTLSVTGQQVYTSSDLGGTLLGVQILPLLVPNPLSSQGEYTSSDLLGITQSNFSSYFAAQPDVDYAADFTSSEITIDYGAAGSYFVQITAENNGTQFTKLYYDEVDDAIGQNPGAGVPKDKVGVGRLMKPEGTPKADLIIVSNQAKEGAAANGYTANALATLQAQGKNVKTADSLDDAIAKIMAESQRLGRAITVDLVGHGTPGTILIGNTTLAAKNGAMTPAALGAALKGKVSNINFFSCNTGQGQPGKDMAKAITDAAMINSIGAFNTFTSALPATPKFAPVFGFIQTPRGRVRTTTWVPTGMTNPGYFDVGGMGIRGALVPEPASLILLMTSLATILLTSNRNRTRKR